MSSIDINITYLIEFSWEYLQYFNFFKVMSLKLSSLKNLLFLSNLFSLWKVLGIILLIEAKRFNFKYFKCIHKNLRLTTLLKQCFSNITFIWNHGTTNLCQNFNILKKYILNIQDRNFSGNFIYFLPLFSIETTK